MLIYFSETWIYIAYIHTYICTRKIVRAYCILCQLQWCIYSFLRLFDNYQRSDDQNGIPLYSEYSQACLSARAIPLSSRQFGKVVAMCFPNSTSKIIRKSDKWQEKHTVYYGIGKCLTNDECILSADLRSKLPDNATLMEDDNTLGLVIYLQLSTMYNGDRVVCIITISGDLHVTVTACEKEIDLGKYGIWTKIPYLSQRKVYTLAKSLDGLRPCAGIEDAQDETCQPKVNFSKSCSIFLQLCSISKICKKCQRSAPQEAKKKQAKKAANVLKTNSDDPPTLEPDHNYSVSHSDPAQCSLGDDSHENRDISEHAFIRMSNIETTCDQVHDHSYSMSVANSEDFTTDVHSIEKSVIDVGLACDDTISNDQASTSDHVSATPLELHTTPQQLLYHDNGLTSCEHQAETLLNDVPKANENNSVGCEVEKEQYGPGENRWVSILKDKPLGSNQNMVADENALIDTPACSRRQTYESPPAPSVLGKKSSCNQLHITVAKIPEKTPSPKTNHTHMCVGTTPLKSSKDVLLKFFPYLSDKPKLLNLLSQQVDMAQHKDSRRRRYDREILSLTLTLWTRSPRNYIELLNAGFLFPSISTLSLYKNCISQKPGLNKDMMRWMYNTAIGAKLPACGYLGGLVLDEMNIQKDLQVSNKGGQWKLVGFTDLGEGSNAMNTMSKSKSPLQLADHVLQFLFHGLTGFRMPFACFPTNQANSSDLYLSVWDSISLLDDWDFKVIYIILDGSSNNRAFLQMHFPGNPTLSNLVSVNRANPDQKVVFLPDPSHVIKKVRNSIFNSGDGEKHTRQMVKEGIPIQWLQWIDAFEWCQDRIRNPIAPHPKLTREHIYLSDPGKMRNALARDVLDENMLHLMQAYQKTLSDEHAASFSACIELLSQTAVLIKFFNDKRPINSTDDHRISDLKRVLDWFKSWETSAASAKELMSSECRQDLTWMIIGMESLVKLATEEYKTAIYPIDINSDVIENFFCSQRGVRGGNRTNPSMHNYLYNINSIVLGQSTISTKSNAGCKGSAAAPYNYTTPGPLRPNRSRKRKLQYSDDPWHGEIYVKLQRFRPCTRQWPCTPQLSCAWWVWVFLVSLTVSTLSN